MNREEAKLNERAADLRLAFDQTFGKTPAGPPLPSEAFLAIGVGGDSYALRLTGIYGLFVDKQVVPLPSQAPDLLGIASFRGVLVPVYDLRVLLGYPTGSAPRLLVLVSPETPIGLAFDHLDGYLDLPHEAITQQAGTKHRRPYLAEILSVAGDALPVVAIASIHEAIKQRAQSGMEHND
jgi:chemotaxis signal transduction protein